MKKRKLTFIIIFTIGILVKYNYLLINIFLVRNTIGLFLNNLIVLSLLYLLYPIVDSREGLKKMMGIYFLFILFFFANIWYNRYFGNYLSFNDIFMGQGIRPIKVLTRQLLHPIDIIFVIDLFVLVVITYFQHKDIDLNHRRLIYSNHKKRIKAFILIVILLISQGIVSQVKHNTYKPNELFKENSSLLTGVYGISSLYAYELYLNLTYDESEVKETKVEKPPVDTGKELSNEFQVDEDTNVMIIQLESFDEKIIGYEHNGQELTPFLNTLKKNSMYFNKIFAQHVNGSFDAEFSFLTSLYPINKNYSFKINNMEEFNSLVRIFNEKNYNTFAFHGNDETFFYRDKGYSELGYDEFYSRKDFSASEGIMEDESYLGLNDYDFFHQSLNYLDATDQPFFSYFITVTSHTPFNFTPESEINESFSDIENPLVRDYFQSVNFVDRSLEMFFNGLEEKNLLDNTLVLIFSDHNADINKEVYTSNDMFESEENIKLPENIPMMIIHPEIEPKVINTAGTTTDMGPTVLDLFGYEEKPDEFLGESLLNEKERPIYFLHELPQIFYKDQLFLRIPLNIENEYIFEHLAHIKNKEDEDLQLSTKQKGELTRIINYMQETMNRLIYK